MSLLATPWIVLAAAVLFPPLGLILLWIRRGWGTGLKILGSAAIVALGIAHLFFVYNMRVTLDGTGSGPIVGFGTPEQKITALEAHRAAQQQEPPPAAAAAEPPAPEVVQAAAPAAAPAATAASSPWVDFRGPGRLGIYDGPILTSWPAAGLKKLWSQPVGIGWGSFTAANGLAFTIEQRRDEEVVAAYDVATGREKWMDRWKARFEESMGGEGPRTTPVVDEGRVYALGALGELRVLDAATGKLVWHKNILDDNGAQNITWAQSASPLIVDGKVVVLPGGSAGKSVVAYDKATGEPVWRSQNDEQSYTAPMVVTLGGKRQLLVVSAERAMGLTIEDGKLLWSFPWVTEYNINSAQPLVVAPNRFFISAGYGHGAAVVELTPNGEKFDAKVVWQNTRMKNKFNTSVLYEGHVYGMDESILACVDVSNGDLKWKGGRYGYGQLLLASGHLVILAETGEVVLVRATPDKHTEVARFEAIAGKTWNHPAIADGVLLVRNGEQMAAFQLGK